MNAAAARPDPIPVYAEMSSVNPVFILAGALSERREAIATGLHSAITLSLGQLCTKSGLIFVEACSEASALLAKLEGLIAATPPGTMLTAGICAAYRAGVERLAHTPGVRCAAQVQTDPGSGNARAGAALFVTTADSFLANPSLSEEVFGPCSLVVECSSREQMLRAARQIEGQLTAAVHAGAEERACARELLHILSAKAGRLVFNGFSNGVEVSHAMTHGGPFPSTSDGRSTSVGSRAMERFLRPQTYQNFPDAMLPAELQEANPLGIQRFVDGLK